MSLSLADCIKDSSGAKAGLFSCHVTAVCVCVTGGLHLPFSLHSVQVQQRCCGVVYCGVFVVCVRVADVVVVVVVIVVVVA